MEIDASSFFSGDDGFSLDEEQFNAACSDLEKNTLVKARAGSGKTRTLVGRTLFLQKFAGIHPNNLLILAFNRKAKEEIEERLSKLLDGAVPFVKTFHSLAHNLVKPTQKMLYDDEENNQRALSTEVAKLERNNTPASNKQKTLNQKIGELSNELVSKEGSPFREIYLEMIESRISKISNEIRNGTLKVEVIDPEISSHKGKFEGDRTSLDGTNIKSYGGIKL